jgi:hypothetical protein
MLNYSLQTGDLNDSSQDVVHPLDQVGANPFPGLRPFTIDDPCIVWWIHDRLRPALENFNDSSW